MERTDYIDFEKKLAFHTAPTLLGIKCSNLMSLPLHVFDVDSYSETFNRKAASKGLKIKTLCECSERKLLLICNEKLLKNVFPSLKQDVCFRNSDIHGICHAANVWICFRKE